MFYLEMKIQLGSNNYEINSLLDYFLLHERNSIQFNDPIITPNNFNSYFIDSKKNHRIITKV